MRKGGERGEAHLGFVKKLKDGVLLATHRYYCCVCGGGGFCF